MSRLWREAAGSAAGWQPLPVGGDSLGENVRVVSLGRGAEAIIGLLVRLRPGVTVRVNGRPILGGFCVLEHKDEILVGRSRVFYSAESTPEPTLFRLEPGSLRFPTCPVCRGPIKDGEQAVQCPGCGRWFHQREESEGQRAKTCWTYSPTCRFCNHPTALTGEPVWRPEMEEGHV
jgi:hypothetical protein